MQNYYYGLLQASDDEELFLMIVSRRNVMLAT